MNIQLKSKYVVWAVAVLLHATTLHAAEKMTALSAAVLDHTTFADWLDGQETPIAESEAKGGPTAVVWTDSTRPEFRGVKFGQGRATRVRHLRIGFTDSVKVGSVLVRGGGTLSVLKPTDKYPGDLADDAQWMPAERLTGDEASAKEVDHEGYALWVLPPGTQTRALRFSHAPSAGDREAAGLLGGVAIFERRLGNVAPQAVVQTVARDDESAKLIDGSNNRTWGTWSNGEQGAVQPISPEHPEHIILTWPKLVSLSGVCLLWTGFSDVDVQAFTGPDNTNTREAGEAAL